MIRKRTNQLLLRKKKLSPDLMKKKLLKIKKERKIEIMNENVSVSAKKKGRENERRSEIETGSVNLELLRLS
jgi:hypothetical protein